MPKGIPNKRPDAELEPDIELASLEPEVLTEPQETDLGVDIGPDFTLESAPHDGTVILLYDQYNKNGVRAYWKKTRLVQGFKWVHSGVWADPVSKIKLVGDWTRWGAAR